MIRGIYFEGWVPARTPARPRRKADFLARIEAAFAKAPLEDSERAVAAVFDLLRRKVSAGEFDQVASAMHKPLRDLFN
jgi:uncharacterized protein (DUF2267 family)